MQFFKRIGLKAVSVKMEECTAPLKWTMKPNRVKRRDFIQINSSQSRPTEINRPKLFLSTLSRSSIGYNA